MTRVIYVDILIVTNFIINYFLLMLTVKLSKSKLKRIRIVIGSMVGSLCSIIILFNTMSFFYINIYKFILAIVIVLISFKYISLKKLTKNIIFFYIVSFIFGGIMTAVWLFLTPSNMVMHNGIVYFNYSITALLIFTAIIYFILNIIIDVYMKVDIKNTKYDVELYIFGNKVSCRGFLDTGNTLKDVYTNKAVIITSLDFIKKYLPNELTYEINNYFRNDFTNIVNSGKIKYIPFNSININGLLPTINIDKIVLKNTEKTFEDKEVLLSISNKDISLGEYDVLLNRLIIH